jgi:hypothetical protein
MLRACPKQVGSGFLWERRPRRDEQIPMPRPIGPVFRYRTRLGLAIVGIGTSFLLKKVSKIPKVKNITVPLIQAQHVVLVSGERILSQGKNQSPKI